MGTFSGLGLKSLASSHIVPTTTGNPACLLIRNIRNSGSNFHYKPVSSLCKSDNCKTTRNNSHLVTTILIRRSRESEAWTGLMSTIGTSSHTWGSSAGRPTLGSKSTTLITLRNYLCWILWPMVIPCPTSSTDTIHTTELSASICSHYTTQSCTLRIAMLLIYQPYCGICRRV